MTKQLRYLGYRSVSADRMGNVFVSGRTAGNMQDGNFGNFDAFVAKYDATGNLKWTRQFGTSLSDEADGLSVDEFGNVYVGGSTEGNFQGLTPGIIDSFIAKYDHEGVHLWTQQLGVSAYDVGASVSADGLGSVYLSGYTLGSFNGNSAGLLDAYLVKFTDITIPEPSTTTVLCLNSLVLGVARWRAR